MYNIFNLYDYQWRKCFIIPLENEETGAQRDETGGDRTITE